MILTVLLLSFMAQLSSMPKPEDVGMPQVGSVQGVVVDPNGKPVEGAVVYETTIGDQPPGRVFRTSTTTDVHGNFVLDHVFAGEKVLVWAYKYNDYMMEPSTKAPVVEVKAGQTVTGVRIQFPQKAGKFHRRKEARSQ